MTADAILAALAAEQPPRPPLRPHVMPRLEHDPPPEGWFSDMHVLPAANDEDNRHATYWYRRALNRGARRDTAARIGRGQALNRIFELGIYRPPVDRRDY